MSGTTYFTSDHHIAHDRDWLWGPRGFDSVQAHDAAILDYWRSTVTDDDTVFFLGDWLMAGGKVQRMVDLLPTLPFKQLVWVLGNHDPRYDKLVDVLPSNVTLVGTDGTPWTFGDSDVFLSHFPPANFHADDAAGNARDFSPPTTLLPVVHGHLHTVLRSVAPRSVHVGFDAWGGTFPTLADVLAVLDDSVTDAP